MLLPPCRLAEPRVLRTCFLCGSWRDQIEMALTSNILAAVVAVLVGSFSSHFKALSSRCLISSFALTSVIVIADFVLPVEYC